jgi:hypothetical protein
LETRPTSGQDEPKQSKLGRVDFVGATLMALTILAFLVPMEIGGVKVPWTHPLIPGLLFSGCVLGAIFLTSQAYNAREPIFPLELLLQKDFIASMLVQSLQTAAQMGVCRSVIFYTSCDTNIRQMMFAVPLYFQITARASNSVAGAHLVPAVVGNAVGGLLAGVYIKR